MVSVVACVQRADRDTHDIAMQQIEVSEPLPQSDGLTERKQRLVKTQINFENLMPSIERELVEDTIDWVQSTKVFFWHKRQKDMRPDLGGKVDHLELHFPRSGRRGVYVGHRCIDSCC